MPVWQTDWQNSHGLSRPSLLLGSIPGDELDLLAAELDLQLIAGLHPHLGDVYLAHHLVAVELDI